MYYDFVVSFVLASMITTANLRFLINTFVDIFSYLFTFVVTSIDRHLYVYSRKSLQLTLLHSYLEIFF